ncbi:MAG: NADH-quinone oxidoreductase subunit K [Candidatus Omnitrophica bacterium]|nr:NADH-quinone oxidoreductase subunit K [Candidatus Omnitrophota bacterium]
MNSEIARLFWSFSPFIIMLFIIGLYCIFVTFNLIRVLVGVEVLMKAATLLVIVAGAATGHIALAQVIVVTLIVIEVVVITIAAGVVIGIWRHNNSLDTRKIRQINDEGISDE